MRQLLLLRHAKSSWDEGSLSDHARPLNMRGRRAADAMAEHDWIVFTTVNGVEGFMHRLFERGRTRLRQPVVKSLRKRTGPAMAGLIRMLTCLIARDDFQRAKRQFGIRSTDLL